MLTRLLTFSPVVRPPLAAIRTDPWLLDKRKDSDRHHPSCYRDQVRLPLSLRLVGRGVVVVVEVAVIMTDPWLRGLAQASPVLLPRPGEALAQSEASRAGG